MCDFHSCVIRADGALAHVAGNSHSIAVQKAGWAENEPHKRPRFVEAEWDGIGKYPGADIICRVPEDEELTAKQRATCDRHYKALADVMNNAEPSKISLARFEGPEFSDVAIARLRKLPGMVETVGFLAKRIAESGYFDDFSGKFLAAWKPEKDNSMVWPRFALWLMTDEKHGVLHLAKTQRTKNAINDVAELYARWIETGKKPDVEEWRKIRDVADAAGAYVAAAAADAAGAGAYVAYAAADGARKLHWIEMAKKLLELIS